MIALFTDFGLNGPYVGQMKAVLQKDNFPIIDLMHDAPAFNPVAASYLLAAIVKYLPEKCIIIAIVDPGVGSKRKAVALKADDRWYVGPDNGLLDIVAESASDTQWFEITHVDENISSSFHGRDVFSPAALKLFNNENLACFLRALPEVREEKQLDLDEIIYVDGYGNLMTGIRASQVEYTHLLTFKGIALSQFRTFSDVKAGQPFYYENSQGLLEIAVNSGSAQHLFQASIGDKVVLSH